MSHAQPCVCIRICNCISTCSKCCSGSVSVCSNGAPLLMPRPPLFLSAPPRHAHLKRSINVGICRVHTNLVGAGEAKAAAALAAVLQRLDLHNHKQKHPSEPNKQPAKVSSLGAPRMNGHGVLNPKDMDTSARTFDQVAAALSPDDTTWIVFASAGSRRSTMSLSAPIAMCRA